MINKILTLVSTSNALFPSFIKGRKRKERKIWREKKGGERKGLVTFVFLSSKDKRR